MGERDVSAVSSARPPAEWELHRACWVAWPSDESLWPELARVQQTFVQMCRGIGTGTSEGEGERLEVLVASEAARGQAQRALSGLDVRLHSQPFGDIWLRDSGPVFLDDGRHCAGFTWTGWGGKYDYPGDAEVAAFVAAERGLSLRRLPVEMEGGGLEHDGEGTLITTRECALEGRNAGMSAQDFETALREGMGVARVIWLGQGLHGDHTDGHVDNLARFVAPGRVLCARAASLDDPQRGVLEAVEADLRAASDAAGRALDVTTLPSPGRIEGPEGLLPASYLNFYIANRSVVVPVYGSAQDAEALEVIAGLFPGRALHSVDAHVLLAQGGAVHCITQQEPLLSASS